MDQNCLNETFDNKIRPTLKENIPKRHKSLIEFYCPKILTGNIEKLKDTKKNFI